ncbi:MAG: ATP-binding protein [Acidobacteria bacterium]|nr:ATP-binding protein [Acidobacteriota bacterium]
MIARRKLSELEHALSRQAAVALIGPRQVGKTTMAFALPSEMNSVYLDLESSEDRRKLTEPALFLRQFEERLVVLDEIHRAPQLFQTLRGLIDEGRRRGKRAGRFLLLGSASMDLLRQSGESLAGRIALVDLGPLDVLEVGELMTLWVRGGFPDSYLAGSNTGSAAWRRDFIRSYLEREIPQLGPRIPAETLGRLWTMLAHNQGGLLNASKMGSALLISAQTVTRYVDLLADLLLVRRLQPFHSNAGKRIVKAPKAYVRDSGIVHTLLGLGDFETLAGHPVVGLSWEGFVVENLLAVAPEGTTASYYRTSAGAEIDLLLEIPGRGLWAIDIKRGLSVRPQKGFHLACEDVQPARRLAVSGSNDRYWMTPEVEAMGVVELARELAGG